MQIQGAIALITLDRPQALNALDLDSLQALREHLEHVRDNPALRVAVITGAGERAFCVGADLKVPALRPPHMPRRCSWPMSLLPMPVFTSA